MRTLHGWRFVLGTAGLTLSLVVISLAQETAPPATPVAPGAPASPPVAEGLEVSARGPIHEAFAEPVTSTPNPSPVVQKKPPDPIEELPPDQKPEGDHITWMPGYWSWDEERKDYLWVSGFWRSPPPGRQWTPGHWKDTQGGWQWAPGFWAGVPQAQQAQPGQQPAAQQVTYLPPPPPPAQTAPSTPAPSADYNYVPGCWIWRGGRYNWQPGYWVANRPNWVWVPAHYVWTPCGYVFVDGYWDYSLRERGLLFAPVYVSASLYGRPGYYYTPAYAIQDQCLYGALFVRPGYSGYYFGDYFGAGYRGNYVAWCDYRVGYYRDPLFSYYSWHNRGNPGWAIGIQTGYVSIYAGRVAPPPRTLVVRNTIVRNTTVINNTTIVNNTNVRNTQVVNNVHSNTMLTPLNQVKSVNLQPVSMAARQSHQQAARQVVQASAVRGRTEAHVLSKGPPPTKLTDPPRSAAMNLPRTPSAPASAGAKTAASPAVHSSTPAPAGGHGSPTIQGQPAVHPGATPAGGTHPGTANPAGKGTPHPTTPQRRPPPKKPAHGTPER